MQNTILVMILVAGTLKKVVSVIVDPLLLGAQGVRPAVLFAREMVLAPFLL